MTTKQAVLELLEKKAGDYISGSGLAAELSVSRNSVWKAIEALREDGCEIIAVTNKGYCLAEVGDALSEREIKKHMGDDAELFTFEIEKLVTSTSDILKKKALAGAVEFTVAMAEEQSGGRGRLQKSFFSPRGSGLYISILLRPKLTIADTAFITSAAAVAVCEAIEETCGKEPGIKWVNDVFLGGGKVCGILTEAGLSVENSAVESAVLGIGINLSDPEGGFTRELAGIAASVFGSEKVPGGTRNRLAAALLKRLRHYYETLPERGFLPEYKRRSIVTGKKVTVITPLGEKEATALKIDDDCRLIIKNTDGSIEALNAGEVSMRGNWYGKN